MPRITYPDVPNASGVPQVLREVTNTVAPVLGAAAGISQLVRSFTSKPVWGIYKPEETARVESTDPDTGEVTFTSTKVVAKRTPVVTPDSITEFGNQAEWSVTSAPTQNGSFADYNRVAVPSETHVRMTKGGSEADRYLFIKQIEALNSTQLYDIVTPEKTYSNRNITRFEITRRGEKGAFWLSEVDLYFREIRVVTSAYENTSIVEPASTSAANVQNNGTQQGITSSAAVPTTVNQ